MSDSKRKSSPSVGDLLDLNRLVYSEIGDLSVVDSRTQRKIYANKTEYKSSASETITFEFGTGSSWIYGPTSYLVFEVKATTTATTAGFEKGGLGGSAMNLFKSIYITMRIYTTIVQTKSLTWNNSNDMLNALKWALYCSEVIT